MSSTIVWFFSISPTPGTLLDPLAAAMEEIDAELTRGLTAAERQTLIDLMVRVTDNARTLLSTWDQSVADVPAEIEPCPKWTIGEPRLRPADVSDRPALPDSHLTSWGGCSAR